MRRRAGLWVLVTIGLLLVLPEVVAVVEEDHVETLSAEAGDVLEDEWEDLEDDDENSTGTSRAANTVGGVRNALLQLNDQNAVKILKSHEYVLVIGYASWCKQSAAVMVDFAEAASILARKGSSVVLAKIDAIANPETAGRYNIKGFPTILFFRNGSEEIYGAGHTSVEFVNWVRKRTGFPATTVSTIGGAEEIQSLKNTLVVGFFEKFEGPEYEEFIAVSVDEDVEFIQTTIAEVAKSFSLEIGDRAPAIGLWKSVPEYFVKMGGQLNRGNIRAFVDLNKYALVTKLHALNQGYVYASPVKKQVLLFATINDYEATYPLFMVIAKEFKGMLIFLWVDVEDEAFAKPMLTMYGITESEPIVAGFDNSNGFKYLMESEVTKENVKAFATNFAEGTINLYYKSEPIPKKNKGEVKIIVGKTFEELVLNSSKDMILQVYTPYCYDCDAMGKVFVKLAKHFKNVSTLVFGKIDGVANEHQALKVTNYPSILFYPSNTGGGHPVPGPSKPNLKKLVKFVEEMLKPSASKVGPTNEPDTPTTDMKLVSERHKASELESASTVKKLEAQTQETDSQSESTSTEREVLKAAVSEQGSDVKENNLVKHGALEDDLIARGSEREKTQHANSADITIPRETKDPIVDLPDSDIVDVNLKDEL